jgi:hypothetical protein
MIYKLNSRSAFLAQFVLLSIQCAVKVADHATAVLASDYVYPNYREEILCQ